jgi:hypothetical protein
MASLGLGSTLPEGANYGDGDEEPDELHCPPKARDAIDAVQLGLLPARTWRRIVQRVSGSGPVGMDVDASVRIARRGRRVRSGVTMMRRVVRIRACGGRTTSALPGVVRAAPTRLVRCRVVRVRLWGRVMMVVLVVVGAADAIA